MYGNQGGRDVIYMRCVVKCAQGEDIQAGDLCGCNDVGELVRAHKICIDPLGDIHGRQPIVVVAGKIGNDCVVQPLTWFGYTGCMYD
jgi:hypothetical protein